jgi:hypothetical protein
MEKQSLIPVVKNQIADRKALCFGHEGNRAVIVCYSSVLSGRKGSQTAIPPAFRRHKKDDTA